MNLNFNGKTHKAVGYGPHGDVLLCGKVSHLRLETDSPVDCPQCISTQNEIEGN